MLNNENRFLSRGLVVMTGGHPTVAPDKKCRVDYLAQDVFSLLKKCASAVSAHSVLGE
jgi:hypothetical protein